MSDRRGRVMAGLLAAILVGYFLRWMFDYDWFRPIGSMAGLLCLIILTRLVAGKD